MKIKQINQALPFYQDIVDNQRFIDHLNGLLRLLDQRESYSIEIYDRGLHVKCERIATSLIRSIVKGLISFYETQNNELKKELDSI